MNAKRNRSVVFIIANGQTTSQVLDAGFTYGNSDALIIHSPATLPETVTIEVSHNSTTWQTFQTGSTPSDATVPAAGKAANYTEVLAAPYIRLKAGTAVAADRTFVFSFQATY